jgi:hypothetical protein
MKNINAVLLTSFICISGCTNYSNYKTNPDAYFSKSVPQKEKTEVYRNPLEAVIPRKEDFEEKEETKF